MLLFIAQVVVKEVEVEVEVESQQMAGQRQALENYSRAVEEQRNRLGQVMGLFVRSALGVLPLLNAVSETCLSPPNHYVR